MAIPQAPWADVDPALADLLRPALPAAVTQVIAEIPAAIPEYRRPLDGSFRRGLERGVEIALSRMLDLLGRDEPALGGARAVYERLGAGEYRAGRPLESLQAAYRLGARVTWRSMAEQVTRAAERPGGPQLPRRQVVLLAEALFAYIDELSGASAAGYAREQSAEAGHLDALRTRLVELVVTGGALGEGASSLAGRLRWPVPRTVRVAVLGSGPESAGRRPVLGPEVLLGEVAGDLVGLLPGGSADRARAVLAGAGAVVGTEQPVEAAATSWAHARALLALLAGRDGGAPPGPQGTAVSVVADDHLADLAVAADRSLVQALRRIALAPLSGLPPPRRQVLEGTLRSWLEHHGNRPAVALELVVHPQTVSYRMARLRALFGDRLDDPQARFGLQVALHAGPAGPVHPAGGQAPH